MVNIMTDLNNSDSTAEIVATYSATFKTLAQAAQERLAQHPELWKEFIDVDSSNWSEDMIKDMDELGFRLDDPDNSETLEGAYAEFEIECRAKEALANQN